MNNGNIREPRRKSIDSGFLERQFTKETIDGDDFDRQDANEFGNSDGEYIVAGLNRWAC